MIGERYRDRTGKGQHLDVGLLDAYYHCHEVSIHQYSGSHGEMKDSRRLESPSGAIRPGGAVDG
jgi:crotonobetainyl-CoA:carnitine CoA-transferase CaiB-like acyl-CoA transferase